MSPRRLLHRLVALVRQDRFDRELDGEVQAHLELAERDARARGLDPAQARAAALRAFGGVDQMKEAHRDARSPRWIENVVKDIRYGFASLRREPAFTLIAVGVLALGIGANTAMFSLVDGVLLEPLPFPEPDRIVRVWEAPSLTTSNSTTALNFTEIKRRSQSFEALSAESLTSATVAIGGEPARLNGRLVSADHFAVFGIQPLVGRAFREDEDQPGSNRVIVISHAAWQLRFGGDPRIVGRTILLDNEPHEVIGVLPPGAFDRDKARPRDEATSFWKPQGLTARQMAVGSHFLNPVGRLKPGLSLPDAQRDLTGVRAQIADLIPAWKQHWGVSVEPFDARLIDDRLRQSIYVALGAVVLVLLIACANITNLLLARGAARQKEMAVRSALGASRGRLVAQLLTESLVLGALGGMAGVVLAAVLLRVAIPVLPLAMPYTAEVELNLRVLAFASVAALVVSVLVGVLPAVRVSAGSVSAALNSAGRGSSGSHDRIRRIIVSAEVAVSLVLICGSLLLFRSLLRLQQVDIGVRVPDVVTATIDIALDAYPTADRAIGFYTRLVEELRSIPGVESASVSGDLPLEGTGGENLLMPGRSERVLVRFKRAGAGYFETLGVPLVAGRTFTSDDRLGSDYIVVINEAMASQLKDIFGVDPLGEVVDVPALGYGTDTTRKRMQVVGVVGNERVSSDLRQAPESIVYVPLAQAPVRALKLAVRSGSSPTSMTPAIRESVRRLDPRIALADVRTMEQIRDRSLSGVREPAWLIGIFAVLSALLAALGLYGVVSHSVAQQRREIGIRMALGAGSNDVLSLVVRNVLTMMVAGLAVGLVGAAALTRVTRSLLFEVSALDPVAFVAAGVAMAMIGAVAAVVPARRATRVDPSTALRAD